jgi:rubrerythrin
MKTMKKIKILFAIAASIGLLTACTETPTANSELQKPIDAQVVGAESNERNENEGSEAESAEAKAGKLEETTNSGNASANTARTTTQDMLDAFEGETNASAKYAAYSKKAETEGLHSVAMLFKATSTSENIHANNHKAVLEDMGVRIPAVTPKFTVGTTAENLKDAIAGESYEVATMYPEFITRADAAQNQLGLVSLNYAYKTEIKHKSLYEKTLAAVENKTATSLPTVYYVCPTCGNTYDATPPKRCGISMTGSEKFIKIVNLNS